MTKSKSDIVKEYLLMLKEKGQDISILPKNKALEIAKELGVSESLVYKVKKDIMHEKIAKESGGLKIVKQEKQQTQLISSDTQIQQQQQVYSPEELELALKEIFEFINDIIKKKFEVEPNTEKMDVVVKRMAKVLSRYITVESNSLDIFMVITGLIYMYSPIILYLIEKWRDEHDRDDENNSNNEESGTPDTD